MTIFTVGHIWEENMPKFSRSSLEKLETCHTDLQRLMHEVIKTLDVTIICGYRNKEDQDKAFANRTSKLKWPHGKHNKTPSLAVDVAPYPVDWNNLDAFYNMGAVVKKIAKDMGISITWGGDWVNFRDLPHIEIKEAV